jgi:integrase
MALTDTEIRKSKPAKKTYRLSDNGGLYLQITPAGGKLWRWKYRFAGAEKLMALGKYPEISLADARERRDAARKRLANGVDPMAERKTAKAAERRADEHSFEKIAMRWLAHWRHGKTPRHVNYVERRIKTDILRAIGDRPIAEIEAPELVALAQAIQARGANEIAKRSLETTSQVFRYAIAHGLAKRNPAADFVPGDVLKASPTVKNHARVDAKELPELLRSIETYRGGYITRLAMQLMSMTFVRTTELIGAEWKEVDLDAARWDIPASRMKMKTPHVVPLSRQAIKALEVLRSLTGTGELLFPGDRVRSKPMSNSAILQALEAMGYKGRMTGHGFRGLASTILHEQGYPHEHIEMQLSH